MDEVAPEMVAYHEAGHVVMAYYLGGTIEQVTILPENDSGPRRDGDVRVVWRSSKMATADLHRRSLLVALAGPVAEMIYTGQPYHPGFVAAWKFDWQAAWNHGAAMMREERGRLTLMEQTTAELHQFCSRDDIWQAIAVLADELTSHETLDEQQIRDALEPWIERKGR
jgi:hypothetical protein